MSNYLVTDTELTSVADAIRTKGGTSAQLSFPSGFVSAIGDISTGGGNNTVTITSQPTTTQDAYDAVYAAIGGTASIWIAWVDYSAAYYENVTNNIACIVGCTNANQRQMWRTDNTYDNFRKFAPGTATCAVPSGTIFNYVIIS